jgi:hypothetical protein
LETLKRIGIGVLFLFLTIAFLSWQSGTYAEHCNDIQPHEKTCPSYNLAPFIFIEVAEFFHRFESAFVVLSTIAIAWFTYELRTVTGGLKDSTDRLWEAGEKQIALVGGQLDLAVKQHGLAREEYFASHLPRITVTRMTAELIPNWPVKIDITYVNNGEAIAKRCNWNAGILILNTPGAIHGTFNYETNKQGWIESQMAIGTGTQVTITNDIPLSPLDHEDIQARRKFLHVIGTINCEDNLGVSRSMGFFRWFDPDRRRFRAIDDSEYEYQDQD